MINRAAEGGGIPEGGSESPISPQGQIATRTAEALRRALQSKSEELQRELLDLTSNYAAIKEGNPEAADEIVACIVEQLCRQELQPPEERHKILNLDALHNWMPYGDDRAFYKDILQWGKTSTELAREDVNPKAHEKFSMRCREKLANILRREWDLDGAAEEFRTLLAHVESAENTEGLPRKGLLKYEIGYIEYLLGNLAVAAKLLHQSADDDKEIGNPIGELISRSVQYLVERMQGTRDLEEMRAFFEHAIEEFRGKQANDPTFNAERWVMNATHHLFDVVVEQEDRQKAEELLVALRTDPFLNREETRSQGWVDEFFAKKEARLAMLRGDWSHALMHWDTFLPLGQSQEPKVKKDEALAEEYFNAGFAFLSTGEIKRAADAWERGRNLDPKKGNKHWQEKIRQTEALVSLRWE